MTERTTGRYCVSTDEDFEPGSNNEVLKNYLGIKSKEQMGLLEAQELKRTEIELADIYESTHQFTVNDICNIHELWLGDIYPCAGKFRTVNMSKDGFPFAAADRIQSLMIQFEKDCLSQYTPCCFESDEELAYALAFVHIEFIIIHPFREGNGRAARLLADLMALQAGRPPLNFSNINHIKNELGFNRYIQAIHAGHGQNVEPLKQVFLTILRDSKK